MLGFGAVLDVLGIRGALPPAVVARIPPGLTSRSDLFDVLASELRLPDYFGHNWDALDECLRDLDWLDPGAVVFDHADLPLAQSRNDRDTYLSVLHGAEQYWQGTAKRELLVLFPPQLERYVRASWGAAAAGDPLESTNHRQAVRARAGEIRDAIAQVLMQAWDPIGVADVAEAADEYDSYAGRVYRLLAGGASESEVARFLRRVEVEEMGVPHVPEGRRLSAAAALVRLDVSLPKMFDSAV